jgi:hypothetical protein
MSGSTILIIEDEEIVSADIADLLQKLGCEVAGSTDTGEEADERDHIVQALEQTHWKVGGKNSAAEFPGRPQHLARTCENLTYRNHKSSSR